MTDHSQLKAAAEAIREGSGLEGAEAQDAMILFDCLTTPDAVLGLLLEIENLRTVQRASFNASGQIKAAAYGLGFNPAQEEGALEYLIGLAREVTGMRAKADCVDDCAHLIRKLVHCRRQLAMDGTLAEKALDYLKRKGLQGSPLRTAEG